MLTSFLTFKGRIGRGMWWLTAVLQAFLILGTSVYLMNVEAAASPRTGWQGPVFFAILLFTAWIGICANIKRYHDRGKSGFWVFIAFVPIVGGIWMFIELGMLPGDEDANDFGPPPGSLAAYHAPERQDAAASKLGKLDDAYFQEYAAKNAASNAPSSSASGNRPAFGRRA